MSASCLYGNLFGNHEHRVKAYAKLPDKVTVKLLLLLFQCLHETESPRLCYRAEIGNQLLFRHADSTVFNDKGHLFWINGYADGKIGLLVKHILIGQGIETRLAQRIRGVGNQLSEIYFRMGIE